MGCIYLNGVPYGDELYVFRPRPASTEASRALMAKIIADMQTAAVRSVAFSVKMRARKFIRLPLMLNSIFPELSARSADQVIEVGHQLMERESRTAHRGFTGFGGEVPALNAKAVILYGRLLRVYERRERAQMKAVA